jgi:hypothetical protein
VHKSRCDQDAGTKVFGTEKEVRGDAQAWEFGDEDWESAATGGHEQNEKQTADV